MSVVLYSYWRSSSSWRVRLALHFKGIAFEYRAVNLLKNEQNSSDYLAVNPQGLVPALCIDDVTLTESMAILEYLEETRGENAGKKSLLPRDPKMRALVRRIAQMVVADIQPVQNLKVLKMVGPERKMEWARQVIEEGFAAIEKVLATSAGVFCVGDEPTLADVCVIPQVYNALRFGVDMSKFPIISRIDAAFAKLDFAIAAHPKSQPDFDPEAK